MVARSLIVSTSIRFSGLPVDMLVYKPKGLHIHAVESRCESIACRSDRSAAGDLFGCSDDMVGQNCGEKRRRKRDD
jgi:hypothetical protein